MSEPNDNTQVIIFTDAFRIRGRIDLIPGARVTDFMSEAHEFIAVTDAEVRRLNGDHVADAPFLDVNRDHIQLVLPE